MAFYGPFCLGYDPLDMEEGNGKFKPSYQARQQWWLPRYEQFFVAVLAAFVLGNLTLYALPHSLFSDWRITACLMIISMGLVVASQARWVIRCALVWLCFLLGVLWFGASEKLSLSHDVARLAPLHNAQLVGVVVDHPNGNPHRAFVDVLQVNEESLYAGRVLVVASDYKLPRAGETVVLEGDLSLPRLPVVPAEFNERAYLQAENVTAVFRRVTAMRIESVEAPTLKAQALRFLDDTRGRMASVFTRVLPSPDAEILGGIVLGGRAIPLDKQTKRQFIDTGLIHILAASGMNVGIVAAFVFWVMSLCRVTMQWRIGVAMAAVAFYAVLTGMPPSIQRASTMLELALLLKLLNRELSPLFLLSIAVAALVAFDPNLVGSLGFQFSVLTTFGLITMMPPLQDWLGRYITRWLAGIVLVPVVAQLWVVPLSLFHFNQFPLHSVFLNMLALFFVVPLTSIGFTAGALSLLWMPLGQWVTWLAWPFVKGLLWVVYVGDAMHWAKMNLAAPAPWLLTGLYGLLLYCVVCFYQLTRWPLRRRVLVGLFALLLLVFPLSVQKLTSAKQVQVAVVPLSYQKAAFVVTGSDSRPWVLLPANIVYWEGRRLSDYLRHENIRHLAALVQWEVPEYKHSSESQAGLSTVLRSRRVDHHHVLSSEHPTTRLTLGDMTLGGGGQYGKTFHLQSKNFCLAGYTTIASKKDDCTLVYQENSNSGYRLFPARFFTPEHFYRILIDRDMLVFDR